MLLVSLCDVSPDTLDEFKLLRQMVESACGGCVTLLVAPQVQAGTRLDRCAQTCEVLRACAGLGDEIALYGATPPMPLDNLFDSSATWLADLDWRALDAEHRLRDDRHLLEDTLGVPIEGFAGTAFRALPWIVSVLSECGFSWHGEDRWIDELPGKRRLYSPLLEMPLQGSELGGASCHRNSPRVVRLALGPGDARRPMLARQLEDLGNAYGPSRSTTHMLQTERRGVPIPHEPLRLTGTP